MDIEQSKPRSAEVEHAAAPTHSDVEKSVAQPATADYATPEEEAAVIRKLDWHIMPLVWVIYMFSILDRSNLGNAHVAGMDASLGLKGEQYALLGTIFYVGYIVSQWTAAGWKHFKPHKWCAVVVCLWASISSLQAATSNFAGEVVLRLLLGITEAMYAGMPVYLSFFYPRDKVGFRQGIFLSASALGNAYGGALGYAIINVKSHLEPWRILFLIEGLPSLLLCFAAWFWLPDSPAECKFLNDRERAVAYNFVRRGQHVDEAGHHGIMWREMFAAFKDWRSYLPALMYFCCNCSFASLPLFVPTIISEFHVPGFDEYKANGLSAPPYLFNFFLILFVSWLSDRMRLRGPFVCFFALVSAVGYILLATTTSAGARYVGIFCAITIFICIAILLPWMSNIHATESKRTGGYTIMATFGQCGPLVGTNIFPKNEGPYYVKGSLISMAFCLVVAFCAALFSFLLHLENRKLARQGIPEAVDDEGAPDFNVRTPKGFKYIL